MRKNDEGQEVCGRCLYPNPDAKVFEWAETQVTPVEKPIEADAFRKMSKSTNTNSFSLLPAKVFGFLQAIF